MSWVQVSTGKKFHFNQPAPESIDLDDIAQGLAMQCRFNGQTKSTRHFYTVAQHCVMMSWIVSKEAKLWALLHDAAEAYVSDVVRPVKAFLQPAYGLIEHGLADAINERFGCVLTPAITREVKEADDYMVRWEAERLLTNPSLIHEWDLPNVFAYPFEPPMPAGLYCWARGLSKAVYKREVKRVLKGL